MKEQFDKKLAEKIEDSFSNHKEPFDPKQWEKFSDAYFKPKKKAWMIYWPFLTAGIAASLLFVFFYFPKQDEIEQKVKSITDAVVRDPIFKNQDEKNIPENEEIASSSKLGTEEDTNDTNSSFSTQSREEQKGDIDRNTIPVIPKTEDGSLSPILDNIFNTWEAFHASLELGMDTLESRTKLVAEASEPMSEKDAQSIVDLWKSSNGKEEPKEVPLSSKSFKLGVMVSPQASSNPVSGMNFGAGIMSEISLSKKLKLDVGLAYANQSMGADVNRGMSGVSEMIAAPGGDSYKINSNIIDTDYRLNFASLDIPVNLKYKFYDKNQTGLYLITGLSSMVYLEQNTVESYQTQSLFNANSFSGDLEYAPSVQSFSNVFTPENGQSNADVAGLLNLSFGYEYQLNKEFYISFEPFYKLPLGGLTFANQQFSIGGVNLRMNFNFKNK